MIDREVPTSSSPLFRPTAANDGMRGQPRNFNMEFGLSSSASLPPSTCIFSSITVDMMDWG